MITYSWIIEQLWVKPQLAGYTDVVVTAAWRCNASDGTYNATTYGTASFAAPADTFVPYVNLTEAEVVQWCWNNGVDQTVVEATLAVDIEAQINPPIITPPLPWAV